ncbi:MAG: heparinase [Rhodobacteraceae bacterium]|nr:MAG: heparinase [Paracoccaceae bacterium]
MRGDKAELGVLPAPHRIGQYARGQQMIAGRFVLAGEVIEARPYLSFTATSAEAVDALQGFDWLDHLAAVGDGAARKFAQAALHDWIAEFGHGAGPGWAPELAGRRVSRLIAHALFLTQGMGATDQARFAQIIALHARYLARAAMRAAPGLARIEALAGYLHAALVLDGMADRVPVILGQVQDSAAGMIGADGGIASRNPEELLTMFEVLTAVAQDLSDRDTTPPPPLLDLLDRIATALRVLRHADGGLARFQGGGRGADGVLGDALGIHARQRPKALRAPLPEAAMGYVRLGAGRCSVLIDAAPPPLGAAAGGAHASTLAFELTSNRRPLIVSCGDGRSFGAEWHRASRASASHSTLSIEGFSSSRFARATQAHQRLDDGPRHVRVKLHHDAQGRSVALSHDGYLPTHGLVHERSLGLSSDGRVLHGRDSLTATGQDAERRLDAALARTGGAGAAFALRFHLHPDAEAALDMNATAVSVALRSGEIWVFRAAGLQLELTASVYLEKGRLKPRPSRQIVLSLRANAYRTQVNWTLAKAQNTPLALRDLGQDDPLVVPPV